MYISYKVKMSFFKKIHKADDFYEESFLIYNQDSFEFWINNMKKSLWFIMLCKVSQLLYFLSRA